MTFPRSGLLIAIGFFVVAVSLSGVLPLWLDEVLQLLETRGTSTSEMLTVLPRNPGAAPLGYLVQQAALRITGYSVRKARLPMALFGSASILVVALLAVEMKIKRAWLAAVLYAIFPWTIRYATESRIYSQALFCSVLATLLFVRAAKQPSWTLGVAYGASLLAAVYTQPFAVTVGLAHFLWSVLARERVAALQSGVAFLISGVLFLPWYLWSEEKWGRALGPNALHFSWTAKTPLMLFRELAGAGYWGSGLLLVLCALAVAKKLPSSPGMSLLLLLIAVPLISGLAADAYFNYFIAARQFLWTLPAVALLAAAATDRYSYIGLALATAFCAVGILQSEKYFTAPHENWETAAQVLASEADQGACVAVTPPDLSRLYEFFDSRVATPGCDGSRMVLAVTPYSNSEQRAEAVSAIVSRGYRRQRETLAGGSSLIFFSR